MGLLFDLKYTLRLMMKNPGFSLLTIAVMTAGLGLCLYMYSFIYSTLLRPLPFENGEHMFSVNLHANGTYYNGGLDYRDFQDIREQVEGLERISAFRLESLNVSNGDRTTRHAGVLTEPSLFPLLSANPLMGRIFNEEDNLEGAPGVAIISYDLWQHMFAGTSNIIGRSFKVNGIVTEIVGVMPKGFYFPIQNQIWLPMRINPLNLERGQQTVAGFIRLNSQYSVEKVDQAIKHVMAGIEQKFPKTNSGKSAYIATLQLSTIGKVVEYMMIVMITAVILILLLACINVGNLLLARAYRRSKETSIRIALGAPRYRLIIQMMWESLIICMGGGILGILLAGWALEMSETFFAQRMPIPIPFFWRFELNQHILLVALAIIVLTTIITGIVPAWRISDENVNAVLRDGTRGTLSRHNGQVNRALVVLEVTLSCAIMIVSGILYILMAQIHQVDYGVNIDGYFTARINLPEKSYPRDTDKEQYFRRLLQQLQHNTGTEAVTAMSNTPASSVWQQNITAEDMEIVNNEYPSAGKVTVMENTMEILGMRLLKGRFFDSRDQAGNQPAAIITDSLAHRLWPSSKKTTATDALGKRIRWVKEDQIHWLTVVGVVQHVIHGQPFSIVKSNPTVYLPYSQQITPDMTVVIKMEAQPEQLRETLINTVASIDPEVPAYDARTLRDRVDRNTSGMNFIESLFAAFALCALLLASSGIYGVISNTTSRRTQEVGIRRALGATDTMIMLMLMRQGGLQLIVGLVLGLPIGYLMSTIFIQFLGIQSNAHLWVYLLIPLIISLVVLLATFIPAKRAIHMQPCAALRYE